MSAPKKYNGHHCWNCWNVSLWIGNDEGLYRAAVEAIRSPLPFYGKMTATIAAKRFMRDMFGCYVEVIGRAIPKTDQKTPDGARYTFKAVRSAMVGLID